MKETVTMTAGGHIDGDSIRARLQTKSLRQAKINLQQMIADHKSGKRAEKAKGNFASLPLRDAVAAYIADRQSRVAEKTFAIDRDRSKPLVEYFKDKRVKTITASDIAKYQRDRMDRKLSIRSINMEV